jgi:hypothetical protein
MAAMASLAVYNRGRSRSDNATQLAWGPPTHNRSHFCAMDLFKARLRENGI